jgi:hypothetical protein
MAIKQRVDQIQQSQSSPLVSSVASGKLWEDAPLELTRRCVLKEVYGDTDTGRTTLALTAPSPIAYIHGHEKVEGVLQLAKRKGKDIKVCCFGAVFRGDNEQIQQLASSYVDRVEAAVSDAFNWAHSIVIDTHPYLWQVYQLAKLGSLTREGRSASDNKKGQLIYTEINNRWRSLMTEFRVRAGTDNRTNLILIGQTTAEYKKIEGKSQATGRTVRSGQKEVGFMCDLIVRTKRNKMTGEFTGTIEKPWWNNAVRGLEVPQEILTFSQIMSLVSEVDESEWS